MATGKYYEGIGRRKSAVARVRLFAGSGNFTVNEKPVTEYFPLPSLIEPGARSPKATQNEDRFTVSVQVKGGGHVGQSGAVSLGWRGRCSPQMRVLRASFRNAGLLTRDPRERNARNPV